MAARWCGSTASHQRRLRQRNQRLRRGSPSQSNSSAHTNGTRGGRRWPGHGDGMRRQKRRRGLHAAHNGLPCASSEQNGRGATVGSLRNYGGGGGGTWCALGQQWRRRRGSALRQLLRVCAKAKRGVRQRNEMRRVTGGHRGVKWSAEARRGLAGQAGGDARRHKALKP